MSIFDGMNDKDLVKALEDGAVIEKFKESEAWDIINEACQRLAKQATEELLRTPASETIKIIELQTVIKLYRDVLRSLIGSISAEGKIAFEEAKERAIINK